jgi:Arc/MetJ family transcription regulator
MRTNIVLDEKLVKEAFKYSQVKTKKELIAVALREFVENRRRMNLLDLKGKVEFSEGYNYKKLREGK